MRTQRPMTPVRRASFGVVGLVGLVGLAACGGDGTSPVRFGDDVETGPTVDAETDAAASPTTDTGPALPDARPAPDAFVGLDPEHPCRAPLPAPVDGPFFEEMPLAPRDRGRPASVSGA
jgi:hypothetical protein